MSKKAWVIVNLQKKNAVCCAESVADIFLKSSVETYMDEQLSAVFPNANSVVFMSKENCLKNADFIVAIGGDGTIIHSAKYAVEQDIPILGINVGRLGFLAQLELSELHLLSKVIEQNRIEERMVLRADIFTKDGVHTYTALNEVLLSKCNMGKIIDMDVMCQDKLVSSYRADGIIFSTSIGSTAYAMSAGGPVIDTSVDCISMTPICPHSMFSRSIVFSPDKVLKIHSKFINNSDDVELYIDGEKLHTLNAEEYVTVRRAERSAKFICLENKDFYEILNKKIMTRG